MGLGVFLLGTQFCAVKHLIFAGSEFCEFKGLTFRKRSVFGSFRVEIDYRSSSDNNNFPVEFIAMQKILPTRGKDRGFFVEWLKI